MDQGGGRSKGSEDVEEGSPVGRRGAGGVVAWPRAGRRGSGARGRDGNRRGRHPLFRDVGALALTDEGNA